MALAVRFLILLTVLSFTGCAAGRQIWGLDRDQLAAKLRQGDYSFLKTIDYKKIHTDDILSLGNSAPYYMGLVFESNTVGMDQNAEAMFLLAINRSDEPWRSEAGYALMQLYLHQQEYEKAAKLGEALKKRYPDSPDFLVLTTQALYWLQKDESVLEGVARIEKGFATAAFRHADVRELVDNGTVALWKAASSVRLERPGWKDTVLAVFEQYGASDIHGRLAIFLQYRKLLDTTFSAPEKLLIEAKYDAGERRYHDAEAKYSALLKLYEGKGADKPPAALLGPATLEDAARTFSLVGGFTEGAATLRSLADVLSGESRIAALDGAGRLYRRADRYRQAIEVLTEAYRDARSGSSTWYTPARRDRILWYLLDSLVQQDPGEAPRYLARYLPDMANYEYFSDVEEDLLSRLVDRHRWTTLAEVYAVLKAGGDPGTAAPYGVVLAEAIDKGLYASRNGLIVPAGGGAPVRVDVISLLQEAASQSYDLYYRFLAAAALDRLGHHRGDNAVTMMEGSPAANSATTPGSTAKDGTGNDDQLVRGYFDYGLFAHAYARVRALWPRLSEFTLRLAATRFSDGHHDTESMRTMDLARRKDDFRLDDTTARLLYPEAFPAEMHKVIRKEKLSPYLFYALVREESYFDSSVASHAGAVGLSQLMPETANDVARRMGLHQPDLSNPSTNLEIGGWYLKSLISRFENPVLALAAYNGGLGRVRQWQRSKDLPSLLLFHESIPIAETRMYIRKILVSSVYYGMLYQHLSLEQVVKAMFPDLMERTIARMR